LYSNESDENDTQFEKQAMVEWMEEIAMLSEGGLLIGAIKRGASGTGGKRGWSRSDTRTRRAGETG
jgi:hypothetical protein